MSKNILWFHKKAHTLTSYCMFWEEKQSTSNWYRMYVCIQYIAYFFFIKVQHKLDLLDLVRMSFSARTLQFREF